MGPVNFIFRKAVQICPEDSEVYHELDWKGRLGRALYLTTSFVEAAFHFGNNVEAACAPAGQKRRPPA